MKLYFIRHGRTDANEQGRYAGSWDVELTEGGREELFRLKESGIYPSPCGKRLATSGMKRAEQTFGIIYGDVPHERIGAFREMRFGDFEGKTYYDLENDEDFRSWLDDETGEVFCRNGECRKLFMEQRIIPAVYALVADGRDTVTVCHGGTISAVMSGLFGYEGKSYLDYIPKSGRGYEITFDGGKAVSFTEI